MTNVPMVEVAVNGRWPLKLPDYRAEKHVEWTDWECERLDAMSKNIYEGDCVWDIGAEEGDLTALFAEWSRPGRMVLFEPNERVWPNIRAIWRANTLPDPALCFPGFAGDETHAFAIDQYRRWPASVEGPMIRDHGFCQLGERPDIPMTRIDDLVAAGAPVPDVITMDVEGSELHVLRGARLTLQAHRPIVFASVHPQFLWDHYRTRASEVHRFMDELGYRSWYLGADHEVHFAWDYPAIGGRHIEGVRQW